MQESVEEILSHPCTRQHTRQDTTLTPTMSNYTSNHNYHEVPNDIWSSQVVPKWKWMYHTMKLNHTMWRPMQCHFFYPTHTHYRVWTDFVWIVFLVAIFGLSCVWCVLTLTQFIKELTTPMHVDIRITIFKRACAFPYYHILYCHVHSTAQVASIGHNVRMFGFPWLYWGDFVLFQTIKTNVINFIL